MNKKDKARLAWAQKVGAIRWTDDELTFIFPDNFSAQVVRKIIDVAMGVK